MGFEIRTDARVSKNDTGISVFFVHGESGGIGHQVLIFGDKII